MTQQMYPSSHFRWLAFIGVLIASLLLTSAFLQGVTVMTALANSSEQNPVQASTRALAAVSDLEVSTVVEGLYVNNTVRPGGALTYTIRFTNTTAVPITDTIITAKLSNYDDSTIGRGRQFYPCTTPTYEGTPPTTTLFTCTGGGNVSYNLTWSNVSLAAGETGFIILHTTAGYSEKSSSVSEPNAKAAAMYLKNTATIAATGYTGGSASTSNILIVGPLLQISKVANPTSVYPGRYVTYTLTASNLARVDSITGTGVVISDVLPESSTFIDATNGGYYDAGSGKVVFKPSDPFGPGAPSQVFSFRILVNPSTTATSVSNSKSEYEIRSREIYFSQTKINGSRDAPVTILRVLQKTYVAADSNIYPGEEVTYTITVYNPYTSALSGVLVTDTLPGNPTPFEYVRPANGSPAPVVSSDGKKLEWSVDIAHWGSVTRSFVVRIPRSTVTSGGGTSYPNILDAYHSLVTFPHVTGLASLKVKSPLVPTKKISTPGASGTYKVQPGQIISYTITLKNNGVYPLTGVRITDTIAGGSYFNGMEGGGPDPLPEYSTNPIVWDGLSINNGETLLLVFDIVVVGDYSDKYCNSVAASSVDTLIPGISNTACFQIDAPVKFDKKASRAFAYPGETFDYVITITNATLATPWTISRIEDTLAAGLTEVGGGSLVTIDVIPPQAIPAGGAYVSEAFSVLISADTLGCNLPKNVSNAKSAVKAYFTSPLNTSFTNPAALAAVNIRPNVVADLIPQPYNIQTGGYFTYTLSLFNQSSVAASNATVTVTLPVSTSYISLIGDNDPAHDYIPTVNGNLVTWTGVNVAALQDLRISIKLQVSPDAALGFKTPSLQIAGSGVCYDALGSGSDPLGSGKIKVVSDILVLSKTHKVTKVLVGETLNYELKITNNDAYYANFVKWITDTLPANMEYVSTVITPSGLLPPIVNGSTIVWQDVTVAKNSTMKWTIQVRANNSEIGNYINEMDAYSPGIAIQPANDAPGVLVYPALSVIKEAGVTETVRGGTVPYTISVVNQTDLTYANVMITDTLNTNFIYIDSPLTPTHVLTQTMQIVWASLTLTANQGITITFNTQVRLDTEAGVYYNKVEASAPGRIIPSLDKLAPVKVNVPTLVLTKQANVERADRGDLITYTVSLNNPVSSAIEDIAITDTLPVSFTFARMSRGSDPLVTTINGAQQLVWNNLSVAGNCQPCDVLEFGVWIDAKASAKTYTNLIKGSSVAAPLTNPGPTAPVTINSYEVTLTPPAASRLSAFGEIVTYTLRIANTGNITNTFTVNTSAFNWQTDLSILDPITLAPGAGQDLSVQVTIPVTSSELTDVVTVYVNGAGGAAANSVLTTAVVPVYDVLVVPSADAKTGLFGESVTYTLHITNTGNVPNTFKIYATDNTWDVHLPITQTTVNADKGQDILVEVNIPTWSLDLDDTVTIYISGTLGEVRASSVLTTSILATYDVDLTPAADAKNGLFGETVVYTLRITNTGNITNTFAISFTGNTWNMNLPTDKVALDAGIGQDFTVEVTIPDASLDLDDTALITVSGNRDASASAQLTTSVLPTYGVNLTPAAAAKNGLFGETVAYTLRITNTGNVTNTFAISFTGNTWDVNLPAAEATLGVGAAQDFTVEVTIPNATLDLEDTVSVTVNGNGGASASAQLTTSVTPTYGVDLTPAAAAKNGLFGETVVYTLRITNTGNVANTFAIGFNGNTWDVNLPAAEVTLGVGAAQDFTVEVTIPDATLDLEDTVSVTVNGNGGASASAQLTTSVLPTSGVALTPAAAAKNGLLGETVVYTLRITNTGNVANTFAIGFSGNTWNVNLPAAEVTLGVGAAQDFTVEVTIPDATLDLEDTVSVTVNGNGGASASAQLTTSVLPTYGVDLTPAAAAKNGLLGETVVYTLRITNTGNVANTFTISSNGNTWQVNTPANPIVLAPRAGQDFTVQVTIPSNSLDLDDTVTIHANGSNNATDSSILTTSVTPTYGVILSPASAAKDGRIGDTVTYTLRITNTGNASETFNITTAGNAWTTDVPATVGPLARDAGQDVQVVVHISAGAAGGAADTAHITVTSQQDGSKKATATLTTTAHTKPVANFSAKQQVAAGEMIAFTNLSSGDVNTCAWTFGDGGTSSSCNNPTHTYTTLGSYTVVLTVTGPGGTDVETKTNYIAVVEGALVLANPAASSTLIYTDTQNNPTIVHIPAGAVAEAVTLAYIPLATAVPPGGFAFGGHAFDLSASQNGILLNGFTFESPVTVTIHYSDNDVKGLIEAELELRWWNAATSAWEDAACGAYDRHPDANWLSVPICHLTTFATFAPPAPPNFSVFMPLIVR